MKTLHRTLRGLSLAFVWTLASTPQASAEIVINNFLSPFSVIRIAPVYRSYTPSPIWIHDVRHHQRCYRRWLADCGEWRWDCVRMPGVY